MNFTIAPSIALKMGFLRMTNCRVAASSDALQSVYDGVVSVTRERFAESPLSDHPVASGVRRLFKSFGIDPSRYRPSGEALVRRILKKQDLHYVNNIVDINNICSIESLFPLGAYDCSHIVGDVSTRLGGRDERYLGIGKEINIADKLVSADSQGAFGSPIADSSRTKITESTREILVLLYAPALTDDSIMSDTLSRFEDLASEHAGACKVDAGIYA